VGTAAHFLVRRGDQILTFDPLRRERVIVEGRMLDQGFAYVNQTAFTTNAPEQMKATLLELLARHPQGLIWDLRDNGGGSMQVTQEVLSYFIEDGLLFSAELKGGERKPFMALGDGIATDVLLAVLIGENTYSSGETAAAAIAGRQRGVLIGSTTHGKGTIQDTIPLVEDCMLHMTIAKWLSPTGRSYDGQGVPPDVFARDDPDTDADEVLQLAVDHLLQQQDH